MNPPTDLALLKHTRVDYGARIDRDGARARRPQSGAFWAILALAPLAWIVTAWVA